MSVTVISQLSPDPSGVFRDRLTQMGQSVGLTELAVAVPYPIRRPPRWPRNKIFSMSYTLWHGDCSCHQRGFILLFQLGDHTTGMYVPAHVLSTPVSDHENC